MTDIQIRHVPDHVKREIKARAEIEGLTLSQYCLLLIQKDLAHPTMRAFADFLREHPATTLSESAADTLAAVRAERELELGA